MVKAQSLEIVLSALLVAFTCMYAQAASSKPVKAAHTTVHLVTQHDAVKPGSEVSVGIVMTMDPHWHTYWRFAGDSGLPVRVAWDLPQGVEAGDIQWPYPHYVETFGLASFGYEGTVLLPVTLRVPPDFVGDTLTLKATVDYLACEESCIPGKSTHTLTLPVSADAPKPVAEVADAFAQARSHQPVAIDSERVSLHKADDGTLKLRAIGVVDGTSAQPQPAEARFFVDQPLMLELTVGQNPIAERGVLELTLTPVSDMLRQGPIDRITGVLVVGQGGDAKAYEISARMDAGDGSSSAATGADAASARGAADGAVDASGSSTRGGANLIAAGGGAPLSLPFALLGAFIGGIVLNIMPCVFPVISIKILGFVQQAGDNVARTRLHGIWFAVGVIVSFWILAAVLLALRAAGSQVGWGFQLNNPAFVAIISMLLFAVGLNLLGVFEVGMSAVGLAGKAQAGVAQHKPHSLTGSFFSGALATVIATPCTAPFMGAAIGFALGLGYLEALLVFTAMGVGMALPYVVLSMFPAWLKWLPRPGAWMETFKQVMAFPVFATVIFLTFVFGRLTGGTLGITVLLSALLVLSMAGWVYGRWSLPSKPAAARAVARVVAVLLAAAAVFVSVNVPAVVPTETLAAGNADGAPTWEPFTAERVAELRAQGRPVFVDYTADWCISCKFNEGTVLASASVMQAFRDANVALLKADWTQQPAHITESMAQFGRASVPLYVLHSPEADTEPVVLPTILTHGMVIGAVESLASDAAVSPAAMGAASPPQTQYSDTATP